MNQIIRILFILFLMIGCSPDDTELDMDDHIWKRFEAFKFEREVALEASVHGDKLWVAGPGQITRFEGKFSDYKLKSIMVNSNHSLKEKPSTNKDMVLTPGDDFVIFYDKNNLVQYGNPSISMEDYDTNFTGFPEVYPFSKPLSVNEKNEILIPYLGKEDKLQFLFLKVSFNPNFKINEWKIILPPGENIRKVDFYKFNRLLNDRHVLVFYDGTYIYNEKGFHKISDYKFSDHWYLDEKLYVFSDNYLHRLEDSNDWMIVSNNSEFKKVNYRELAGITIGYNLDKIGVLKKDAESIISMELDNSGLEQRKITSIVEYRDKVIVTTLSGVFYKTKQEFLSDLEHR